MSLTLNSLSCKLLIFPLFSSFPEVLCLLFLLKAIVGLLTTFNIFLCFVPVVQYYQAPPSLKEGV